MVVIRRLTAIIEREGDGFAAHCPEVDVASQGDCSCMARCTPLGSRSLFDE